LVPTFAPFNFHWNDGVPPFVDVAVNVTFVPAQIVVAEAVIVTEGVSCAVTVIVIAFDVAVAGIAQANEEVITTVTTSLFTSVAF
jgi:hypothetical protein